MIDAAMTSPAAVPAIGVAGAAPAEPGFDAVLAALMGVPLAALPAEGEPPPPAAVPAVADGTLAALLAAAMPAADDAGLADAPAEPDGEDGSSGEAPAGGFPAPAADPALDAPVSTLSLDAPAADAPIDASAVNGPVVSPPAGEAAEQQPPVGDEMPPASVPDPQAVAVPRGASADAPGHAPDRVADRSARHAPRPRASARAIAVAAEGSAVGRLAAQTAEPVPAPPADAAPAGLTPVAAEQAPVAAAFEAAAVSAAVHAPSAPVHAGDTPQPVATAPTDAAPVGLAAATAAVPAATDEAEAAAAAGPGGQIDQPTGLQGAGRAEAATFAPAARPADGAQPAEAFTAMALRRVLDAVEAAEQRSPHTMRVDLPGEAAGDEVLHLIVSVRGHTVHVSAEGGGQDSLSQAWGQELAEVLRRRGLELSGHAGGQDRSGRDPNADDDDQPATPAGMTRRPAVQPHDGALRL